MKPVIGWAHLEQEATTLVKICDLISITGTIRMSQPCLQTVLVS